MSDSVMSGADMFNIGSDAKNNMKKMDTASLNQVEIYSQDLLQFRLAYFSHHAYAILPERYTLRFQNYSLRL